MFEFSKTCVSLRIGTIERKTSERFFYSHVFSFLASGFSDVVGQYLICGILSILYRVVGICSYIEVVLKRVAMVVETNESYSTRIALGVSVILHLVTFCMKNVINILPI